MEIQFSGEKFVLDAGKALFHLDSKSLIIADVHLGKSTHFRKNGIPIPSNIAESDLNRLADLIHQYNPVQIIIAGDFFHASANSEIEIFKSWRNNYLDLKFILVKGNHDRLKASIYEKLGIELVHESLDLNRFKINHHPSEKPNFPSICGHIHPGVNLKLSARQKIRLASFLLQKNQLILPAFSEFTGLDTSLQSTGRNFVIAKDRILEI